MKTKIIIKYIKYIIHNIMGILAILSLVLVFGSVVDSQNKKVVKKCVKMGY